MSKNEVENIWTCKIGGLVGELRKGADAPMRNAVEAMFKLLTGNNPKFIFSGWGGEITEAERAVVEDRLPVLLKKERSCLCSEDISLQSYAGGGSSTGLFGMVTMRIGDNFVDFEKVQNSERPVPINKLELVEKIRQMYKNAGWATSDEDNEFTKSVLTLAQLSISELHAWLERDLDR